MVTGSVFGLMTRVEYALAKIPENLERWQTKLSNLLQQQEAAKLEINKPFPQEEELHQKAARLAELDSELNLNGRAQETA